MISIAITYFNRKKQFINTLISLTHSSVKNFEVIVVDDGSDEDQRIEDLQEQFDFLKVIRINKEDKQHFNPCVPYNLAFSKCSGDFIVIQNAECMHYGDILKAVVEKLNDNNYISFGCYSIDEEITNKIKFNEEELQSKLKIEFLPINQEVNGRNGWYNHGKYRPTGLHFCSAITRNNLKKLNGFDERYANGCCFDDNEFLHRVKILGLQIYFENEQVCLHQYHENFNYNNIDFVKLNNLNHHLYTQHTLKENIFRANPLKYIFKPKIVGFTQLRNELEKGNLQNWFKQMSVCDRVYIFDQNSDDGSKDYYKLFPNAIVIESNTNRFHEELICKQELLDKLLQEDKDADWILWLDGDLLLDGRLLKNNGEALLQLCSYAEFNQADACFFNHYNLWRSDIYYRTDDAYHSLNGSWCPLWRNNGNLFFKKTAGLHNKQYPDGLTKGLRTPFSVVHRGFATDYQIITKYNVYKSNGQKGWALDRLLNEDGLVVELLDKNLLPEWFETKDEQDPKTKKRIKEIYNEENK